LIPINNNYFNSEISEAKIQRSEVDQIKGNLRIENRLNGNQKKNSLILSYENFPLRDFLKMKE